MSEHTFHTNPFPGIRSYETAENRYFFGREKQVAELIEKLRQTRFLAIVGSSGCGKSSLIKAGLIPELFKVSNENQSWKLFSFRPGDDPLTNLSSALAGQRFQRDVILQQLGSNSLGIVEVLQNQMDDMSHALLYVDQFEELFRYKRVGNHETASAEADHFIDLLLSAVKQNKLNLFVVVSMRTDFLDDCTQYRGLSEIINQGSYLVPRMVESERRLAITGPVKVEGAEISTELVERLVKDLGDDPDQLPILQHAMMRTWDHWNIHRVSNEPIDIVHYESIGTMSDALSIHLEEIYNGLTDEKSKFYTEKIFKALTDLSTENRGTRRPCSLREICTLTDAREEEIIRVIDQFRSPGCAFLMPSAQHAISTETTIDISHESIMRVWRRLKRWVEEEGESAQLYLRLSKSAALYQEGKTGLWVNPELQLALQWKALVKPNITWASRYDAAFERALNFLEYSKLQHEKEITRKENIQKRNLRRARNSAIVLGLASLISILFLVISLNLRFKAEASQREALEKEKLAVAERKKTEEQRREAIIQKRISDQQQQIAEQQEIIAEQQRQYAVKQQLIAQQQTSVALQQRKQADEARHEALAARDEANDQRQQALTQKQIADSEREKAEESERIAQRLRLLAIANSMAIQALQLHATSVDALPPLYALTAYQLHHNNGGSDGDATLYAALSAVSNDVLTLRGHQDAVRDIEVTTDGKWLFSCGDDQQLIRWDLSNPEQTPVFASLPKEYRSRFRSLMLTADGQWLVAGTVTGKLIVWPVGRFPSDFQQLDGHESIVSSLLAHPDKTVFYSCGSDGKVLKWRYSNNQFSHDVLDQQKEAILCADVNDAGTELVYAGKSGKVWVSPIEAEPTGSRTLTQLKSPAFSVKYQPHTSNLVFGCQDGSLQAVQVDNNGENWLPVINGRHLSAINALAFSPDASKLASASFDWTIRFSAFPFKEENPVTINSHDFWIYDLIFTPDGNKIISCSADKTIRIFSASEAQMVHKVLPIIQRNMTLAEWKKLVGEDVPYQKTINSLP